MFEAIGEGHKIMAEGPKKEIDLDALEKLAAQATPGPSLVAKVRELERQKVELASRLSKVFMHTVSTKEWLEWVEETGKEIMKGVEDDRQKKARDCKNAGLGMLDRHHEVGLS